MYEKYCKLRDSRHVKDADVAKVTGITKSTFSDWKNGRSHPGIGKLQKIANYFDVSVDYFTSGKEPTSDYYINPDAKELAQFLFENPDYKVLFDASRKVKRDDLMIVKQLLDRFSQGEE